MDGAVEDAVRAALLGLARSGSPVVSEDDLVEMLRVAVRRWRSFERRNPKRSLDLAARTEDLAKGLRDRFESNPQVVGPLMEDYRFVAEVLAAEFSRHD